MNTTGESIKAFAATLPEGEIVSAKKLLHPGERAAVDQALSRLVKRGELIRVRRGLFALPIKTRFGERAPSAETVIKHLAIQSGETVSFSGASAANMLGLTPQNPLRQIYWTSGPSRRLKLGAQNVELQHVPSWQLCAPHSKAGHAFRAMVFYGKSEAKHVLHRLKSQLSAEEHQELFALRAGAPTWLAKELSVLAIA